MATLKSNPAGHVITHVLRSIEKSHHYSAGVNGTSCTLGNQGDLVPIWGGCHVVCHMTLCMDQVTF